MTVLGIYSWPTFWSMGNRMGAESFYLSMHAFIRRGHTLHMVAPRLKGSPLREDLDGIQVHRFSTTMDFVPNSRLPFPLRIADRVWKYVAFQIVAGWNAYKVAKRVRPDAMMAYGAFAVPAVRWVARRMKIPNVTRLFGMWLAMFADRRFRFYADFPEIFAMKIPSSAVILHDDGSRGDDMARRLRVPPERFFYLKNGIDPDFYRPDLDTGSIRRELGFQDDDILLFCVARLFWEKHVDRALRALPEILREEPRVRLFVVGDGPERPRLEELSRSLGVEDAVRFLGAKPREDLYRYFNTGDIFISVSDRTNGGNPTVEAMYCGRCVVVLNTGGTTKLVRDGETGVVVEANRIEELPAAILRVVRDPSLRSRLGDAARRWITPRVPSIEERQRMEVGAVEQAVRETRGEPWDPEVILGKSAELAGMDQGAQ
jgi:glycosyltransferase involved in cell wall biosynthesis